MRDDAATAAPLTPPGAERTTLRTSAGPLSALRAGARRPGRAPVLLIHGGGSDSASISWYRAIEPIARDREVWAIDLPGPGGSIGLPAAGGPAGLAAVAAEAIAAAGIAPAVVAGVSMGGDVAVNLALGHPGSVAGLVLVAPGGLVPRLRGPVTQLAAWLAAQLPDPVLLPAARFANRFAGSAVRAMVHDPATLPGRVLAEFERESRHPRGGIAYGRYNQATLGARGMRNDRSDEVRRIAVPTLLFHGENDRLVDPDGSRRAAQRMPHARLVLVPECGHWAQLEAHDRFVAETARLLAEVDRRADDGSCSR